MEEDKLKLLLKESQEALGSKVTDDIAANMKKMTEEQEALKADVKAQIEAERVEFQNNFMTKYEKIPGAVEAIQAQLDKMDNDLKAGNAPKRVKSVKEIIHEELRTDKFKEFSKSVLDKKVGAEHNFSVKVADMSEQTNLTGEIPLADQDNALMKTPLRPVFMQNLIPVGFTTSDNIAWIDRSAETYGAAMRAEEGVYIQSDLSYTRRTTGVKSLATFYKVSDEMFADVDYIQSEIRTEGIGQMERLIDAQMLTGNGTGNNIVGIQANATAFSAPTGTALSVQAANNYDCIMVAALQAQNAYYTPDTVIMTPTNWMMTLLSKDQNNNYIIPPFVAGNMFTYGGLRVVANAGQTADTIDVFQSDKAKLFIRQNILVRIWDQNDTDPIYGLKTITLVARVAQRISAEHYGAFINGTLTDIKLAINQV